MGTHRAESDGHPGGRADDHDGAPAAGDDGSIDTQPHQVGHGTGSGRLRAHQKLQMGRTVGPTDRAGGEEQPAET